MTEPSPPPPSRTAFDRLGERAAARVAQLREAVRIEEDI